MQFKEGAPVYTVDGQEVGRIERVVLDPETDEVTHVVVLRGWLFTEDKVVPTSLIDMAVEDRVQLSREVQNLDELPPFEETHYVLPDELAGADYPSGYAPPVYWYPPIGAAWPGYYTGYYAYPVPPYIAHTEQNIPEGTVALKEGAKVISADGQDVGKVERIFTNDELNRATHVLIEEGWLFKEKRLIPVEWIRMVREDEIYLSLTVRVLERVPEYQG